jgi:hypothetical protein
MATTYHIRMTDTDATPSWVRYCDTMRVLGQDDGKCTLAVTATRWDLLEPALDADDDVISYQEIEHDPREDAAE